MIGFRRARPARPGQEWSTAASRSELRVGLPFPRAPSDVARARARVADPGRVMSDVDPPVRHAAGAGLPAAHNTASSRSAVGTAPEVPFGATSRARKRGIPRRNSVRLGRDRLAHVPVDLAPRVECPTFSARSRTARNLRFPGSSHAHRYVRRVKLVAMPMA